MGCGLLGEVAKAHRLGDMDVIHPHYLKEFMTVAVLAQSVWWRPVECNIKMGNVRAKVGVLRSPCNLCNCMALDVTSWRDGHGADEVCDGHRVPTGDAQFIPNLHLGFVTIAVPSISVIQPL